MSKTPKSQLPGCTLKIHNRNLVVKCTSKKQSTTLVIKHKNPNNSNNYTYLSDVLSEIPPGIVHKEETGMGSTSMELTATISSPKRRTSLNWIFNIDGGALAVKRPKS